MRVLIALAAFLAFVVQPSTAAAARAACPMLAAAAMAGMDHHERLMAVPCAGHAQAPGKTNKLCQAACAGCCDTGRASAVMIPVVVVAVVQAPAETASQPVSSPHPPTGIDPPPRLIA